MLAIFIISVVSGIVNSCAFFWWIKRKERHSHPIINMHYKSIKSNELQTLFTKNIKDPEL
jgi:hypothetical protein